MGRSIYKVKIDLNSFKNAMGNSKAFNSKTLLLTLPQMVLPLVLYWAVSTFFGHTIGCISVGSIGILGILFKDLVLNIIIKTYKIEKYSTISAYKEQISYDKIKILQKRIVKKPF